MLMPKYKASTLTTPDGATIHYMETGSGTPVLLIPGGGDGLRLVEGSSAMAVAFMYKPYAPKHRLVVMSRREPIPMGWGPEEHARDYIWAMEQLGMGPTHVECNSAGGPIGQQIAVLRPDLVRSLVLGQTFAHCDEQLAAVLHRWIGYAQTGRWYDFHKDTIETTGSPNYVRKMRPWLPLLHLYPKPKNDRLVRVLAALLSVDNRPILPQITAPTLIVAGDSDPVTHPKLQQAMLEGIPGARIVWLKGQSHMAVSEVTAEHFRHVLGFMDEVDGGVIT